MHVKGVTAGKKDFKWTTASRSPHSERIPLLEIVRDVLGYADTAREARGIIKRGLIKVNNKVLRDHKFGVGFMDVVEIPLTKQYFRVLTGSGGLYLKEINKQESSLKLCRVNSKKILDGGKIQLNLHDGSNIITDQEVNVNDTVLLELPSLKVKDKLSYGKGSKAMVYRGRHGGELGTIKNVFEGTASGKSLTTLDSLQTLTEYVMVVGVDKPLITV